MRIALTSLLLAVLLLAGGVICAPAASASGGVAAGGTGAPVAVLTGLLAVGFLLAHQAMSDDD